MSHSIMHDVNTEEEASKIIELKVRLAKERNIVSSVVNSNNDLIKQIAYLKDEIKCLKSELSVQKEIADRSTNGEAAADAEVKRLIDVKRNLELRVRDLRDHEYKLTQENKSLELRYSNLKCSLEIERKVTDKLMNVISGMKRILSDRGIAIVI